MLGVYILRPIAWLMALMVGMSALGALLERGGVPVLSASILSVRAVWQGQVWRLVTWAPIELSGLGLIFGCLILYYFGPDLVRHWGPVRFFVLYFGGAALVGAAVCALAFIWPEVTRVPYQGMWPMLDAFIIAWAALYPDRQILMYFVLPISGRNFIWLTIAITVVMAALGGFAPYAPNFVAEAAALVYMDVISVRSTIARARLAWFQRQYRRRTAHLTRIDRDEPPRWTH